MLPITLAQLNLTVGDIEGNVQRMAAAARSAVEAGARMVVFPELSLTGYYPGDLLESDEFLRRVDAGVEALCAASKAYPWLYWVVGAPVRRKGASGAGKPLENCLLVIRDGELVLRYAKQLLPTYNVFDERRHFEPGPECAALINVDDVRVGFLLCEDGWNDAGADYPVNPFQRLVEALPDLIVSMNASPSDIGKREQRHEVFSAAVIRHGIPVVYVNQVGGQDQLVYDGASFAMTRDGKVVFESARFEEDLAHLVFDPQRTPAFEMGEGGMCAPVRPEGLSTMEFYRRQIVLGLRDYARRCGFTKAVVGSSGGIDSALTLALAVEALGAENVVAITMPSTYSSAGSVSDSQMLCQNLGIVLLAHPIKALFSQYVMDFESTVGAPLEGLARENLQARIRGTILMEYSNTFGHLLLTTGNKSEVSVGYATLYGDTSGGLGLIGDLYKTEVFALARHINATAGRELIPAAIIAKAPSAELAPGQKDTDSLPPYEVLDEILKLEVEGSRLAPAEAEAARHCVSELLGTETGQALVARVRRMVARSEYKRRQAPPIVRVRARAFGSGRQMPIAAVYR